MTVHFIGAGPGAAEAVRDLLPDGADVLVDLVGGEPLRALAGRAAVDLLPLWARRMHGLEVPLLAAPLVRWAMF